MAALTDQMASRSNQELAKTSIESLGHSGSPGNHRFLAVGLKGNRNLGRHIADAIQFKEIGNQSADIMNKFVKRLSFGDEPRDIFAFRPPDAGFSVPMGSDFEFFWNPGQAVPCSILADDEYGPCASTLQITQVYNVFPGAEHPHALAVGERVFGQERSLGPDRTTGPLWN
jgi:hypothetical protein